MPKVTVAITTYNRPDYLRESIEAVLKQTFKDMEVLVIDNGSGVSTHNVVRDFNDPRLRYIRIPENVGSAGAWSEAMKRAAGDYIVVTHDDDRMIETMIEKQVSMMESDDSINVIGCNVSIIDGAGNVVSERDHAIDQDVIFQAGKYIQAYMQDRFRIHCPTFMLRRCINTGKQKVHVTNKLCGCTKETPGVGLVGDIFLLCHMNIGGKIGFIAEPQLQYREHEGSETLQTTINDDITMHKAVLSLLKWNLKMRWVVKYVKASLYRHMALSRLMDGKAAKCALKKLENCGVPLDLMPITPDGRCNKLAGKRVAIFGSFLNAYLIAKNCQASGVKVVCFLDNRLDRHGKKFAKIPIVGLSGAKGFDTIIISSERRSKGSLMPVLEPLGKEVIHWREL